MYFQAQLLVQSSFLESVGQLAAVAGAVILGLMLAGLGGFAYKSLRGDGIRWPDDDEQREGKDGVQRSDDDDEWKYY